MKSIFHFFDRVFINFARICEIPFARLAIFVVFFWFGALKIIGFSPANPLVSELLEKTMPFMGFDLFILLFGVFEVVIGLSFLFPRLIRVSIAMLAFHMVTTFMPLVLMTSITWQAFLVPTLEGQYIIKNLVIIATAMGLVSHMHISENNKSIISR